MLAGSVALLALSALAGSAQADVVDHVAPTLQWVAPPDCPDALAAKAAMERYLGDPSALPPMAIRVELAPAAEGMWQGRVTLSSSAGSGDRLFQGPTCTEVAEAATLMVAIMVDPLRVAAHVAALDEAEKASSAEQPPARGVAVEAGVETSADLTSLPAPTLGLSLVATVRAGRVLAQTALTGWVPQRAFRGGDTSSGGVIGLYSGSLRGCFDALSASKERLAIGPCAGGELGVATGRGFGFDVSQTTTGPWAAVFAGARARFGSDPVTSWLSLDVGTPLIRPVYVIDSAVPVFQASRILVRASLGMAWKFP